MKSLFSRMGLLACLALTAGVALAVAPEIKDDAKFFSPDAIKKANKELQEIMRKYGKDFLIETVEHVPADQTDKVKAMSREDRSKFFQNWASDRAEVRVINGIYVLVCKDPAHLEVYYSEKEPKCFQKSDYEAVRDVLLRRFREKKYDEGLLESIELLKKNLAERPLRP